MPHDHVGVWYLSGNSIAQEIEHTIVIRCTTFTVVQEAEDKVAGGKQFSQLQLLSATLLRKCKTE